MTAADLSAAPGDTYDERLANVVSSLEATITGTTHGDDASNGPPEPVVADADTEWFANREERRDERSFWGGAA